MQILVDVAVDHCRCRLKYKTQTPQLSLKVRACPRQVILGYSVVTKCGVQGGLTPRAVAGGGGGGKGTRSRYLWYLLVAEKRLTTEQYHGT